MKKILFIILVILFSSICFSVSAETFFAEISDDKVLVRKTQNDGNVILQSIDILNHEDHQYLGIRAMAQSTGAEIEWVDSTKSVRVSLNNLVILFQNGNNDIFVNGNLYNFNYPVIIIDGTSYAPIEIYKAFTGELNLLDPVNPSGNYDEIIHEDIISVENGIESDRIIINTYIENIIHDFLLINPSRLVIDVKNLNISGTLPSGNTFSKIRYFTGADGITRIVFDLTGEFSYTMNQNGSSTYINISSDGRFNNKESPVEYRNNSIIIKTADYSGYSVIRSSNPFSIKILLPVSLTSEAFKIIADEELVIEVIVEPIDSGTSITVNMEKQCAFELEKMDDVFIIGIYEPVVNNITYHNDLEGHFLNINGIAANDNIVRDIKSKGLSKTIRINDPKGDITSGQIYINDDSIKSIFVIREGNTAIVHIEFKTMKYLSISKENNSTRIYLHDNNYEGKLVVISAGHGGSDPGAITGDVYEADINLSIASKLQKELELMGVEVHMLRTDNTFISLDDRTYTANKLKADLFISIHCNSLEDPNFDGLMTLVHSGYLNYENINGRTAGTIIHKELITATGATDRGVRYRDKIIVLKDTAMPAVEIEAGFLTNEAELVKLLDDSYQWTIAKGAAGGILKVLDLID